MTSTDEKTFLKIEVGEDSMKQLVEVEILQPDGIDDPRKATIADELSKVDERLAVISSKVDELNTQIDSLTNKADGLDYAISVASGILTGLIDSFWVGEFNFSSAKADSNKMINDFIMNYAKRKGFEGDRLNNAIEFLEKKYPVPQDNSWSGKGIGVSAKSHHLDDLAHHPTILGLISSIIVEFFRVSTFVNKNGEYHFTLVETKPKDMIKIYLPVAISGLLLWMARIAEKYCEEKMDVEIPKPIKNLIKALAASPMAIKLLKVSANWAGHLVSDMGGSKNTAGGGMGIPGLFLSLLKEISSIPGINLTPLPKFINDLYVNNKLDMRAELAVGLELGKQAVPVIINELLVRGFYFVRHLIEELKNHEENKQFDWKKILPLKNRTVVRMLTIATGTFTAVDAADAAIRSGGFNATCILRLNFVGIGRFAIALGTDIGMGIKKAKCEREKMRLTNEQLQLLNAKVFYKQADMWIEAQSTCKAIDEVYILMDKTAMLFLEAWNEMENNSKSIKKGINNLRENDPDAANELLEGMKWGF